MIAVHYNQIIPTSGGRGITVQHHPIVHANRGKGLGFFDSSFLEIAVGLSTIIGTAASAGVSIYGTIEQTKLAKEAAELQNELAERRFSLEEELAKAQQRIYDIQSSGLEARQDIDLAIAQIQSEVLTQQLEKVKREQELQAQINEIRLQRELEAEQQQYLQDQLLYQQMQEQSEFQQAAGPAGDGAEAYYPAEQQVQVQQVDSPVEKGFSVGSALLVAVPAAGLLLVWAFTRK